MTERLQKILSMRGVASRRKAEEMISSGRVVCNGQVCTLGQCADPDEDEILVDGQPLPVPSARTYLMLNKPKGYVTTLSDEKGRPNAAQLVSDCGKRVYPVGRLDMDSEGLLIFTDDGELANHLMHPSHEIKKTYLVWVKNFTPQAFYKVQQPVNLDGYVIKKPNISLDAHDEDTGRARLRVTIHEGRNRQVRRMCAMAGMQVLRLVRISEGKLKLGRLAPGKWRFLSEDEVQELKK